MCQNGCSSATLSYSSSPATPICEIDANDPCIYRPVIEVCLVMAEQKAAAEALAQIPSLEKK
jgi:hypothetical protein